MLPLPAAEPLRAGAVALRARSHAELAALIGRCRRSVELAADAWVEASLLAKGWSAVSHARAEEWASGPLPVARFLHALHDLQRGLAAGHLPRLRPRPVARGTPVAFDALPAPGLGDALLLAGHRARVECPADVVQREPERCGDVALVLGAGNVTATPVLDVLHQVFLCGRTVLLKLSPLHAAVAPALQRALEPLVAAGLLHIVCGDGPLGRELARDAAIAAVHLTGSTATWASLREDAALAGKHLTAEVGCCTPAFVLPGEWRDGELRHVARQLAAYAACNGGATCLAPRLVLTAQHWPQREPFLQHLQRELAALPARTPFHGAAREHFARAAGVQPAGPELPPTLRAGLDAGRHADLWASEPFAPVLLELPLPGPDVVAWLAHAAGFVRDRVHGALSAYLFAPGRILGRSRDAVADAVRALPHGTIAINCWTGLGYGLGVVPWGVPASAAWQHGAGWTRGTLCLPATTRTVIEAPFRSRPLAPWLPAHRTGSATLSALTHHYLDPSPLRLARTALLALCSP